MKFLNHKLLLSHCYKLTKDIRFFHDFFRLINLKLLIPFISKILMIKNNNIIQIIPRHSINLRSDYNVFMSDLDLDIVTSDNTDLSNIFNDFSTLKKIFPLLDWPEVYYQSEYTSLNNLKMSQYWTLTETVRLIRKINWELKKLPKNEYDLLKQQRSINKCIEKITNQNIIGIKIPASAIHEINKFFIAKNQITNCCLYSRYLECLNNNSIIIEINSENIPTFFSLLPGEETDPNNSSLREAKIAIITREILISKSSSRSKHFLKQETKYILEWIEKLKKELNA